MVDMVVSRLEMRETIARIVGILTKQMPEKQPVEDSQAEQGEAVAVDRDGEQVEPSESGEMSSREPDASPQSPQSDDKTPT